MLKKYIAADLRRAIGKASLGAAFRTAIAKRIFRPVLTLRFCQWAKNRARSLQMMARLLHRWSQAMAGMDLPYMIDAGPGLLIVHG